ncbi:glycine cleavage system protein GcvH [Telmatospirillum sp. J64-1]|uniref:glycine cleavage system protein GcvH n=1 Tax=Telmatospirillum sp. J64-1 TaxID=2502183 RepID=UPI00115C83E1|nr:glycine cleavage system protein GcvH [Telmatospirillum sp. J64-1]
MSETRYTRDHEWVRIEEEGIATVGISEYAQQQLGDVVFVELPAIGKSIVQGGEAAVVESVKAASEVYAPVSGAVIEANDALTDTPALVNEDAEGEGWFFRVEMSDPSELDSLMDVDEYTDYIQGLE